MTTKKDIIWDIISDTLKIAELENLTNEEWDELENEITEKIEFYKLNKKNEAKN